MAILDAIGHSFDNPPLAKQDLLAAAVERDARPASSNCWADFQRTTTASAATCGTTSATCPLSPERDRGNGLQDRYRGALVGVAVGDALGAAFEGYPGPVPAGQVRQHLDGILPVSYTDDTAMTIAAADPLLHCDGLDEDNLAGAFAARHEHEPDRGYGAGTVDLLQQPSPTACGPPQTNRSTSASSWRHFATHLAAPR